MFLNPIIKPRLKAGLYFLLMIFRIPGLIFLTILTIPFASKGQFNSTSHRLSISLESIPVRDFKSNNGSLKSNRASINYKVPVLKKLIVKDTSIRVFQINFNSQALFQRQNISFEPAHQRFYQARAGINIATLGAKNSWIGNINGLLIGELKNSKPIIRPTTSLLYVRTISKKWALFSGFAYNFAFGKGIGLPILGFRAKTGSNGVFSLLLPYRIQYSHRLSKTFRSQTSFQPSGGFNIFYSSLFNNSGSIEQLVIRNNDFRLTQFYFLDIDDRFQLRLGFGLLMRRKLWISKELSDRYNSKNNLFAGNPNNGIILDAGIIFNLAKRKINIERTSPKTKTELDNLSDSYLEKINLDDLDIDLRNQNEL